MQLAFQGAPSSKNYSCPYPTATSTTFASRVSKLSLRSRAEAQKNTFPDER